VEHNQPIFLVTLVDRSCVTSVSAADVDIEAIKIRLRYGPVGSFGLIEPAYYANLEEALPQRRCISWHLHALVWGSANASSALCFALQASGRYAALVPG
jgi:hypothetical protein